MLESQSRADNECSNESAIPKQPAASISKERKIQKANYMRQYRANKMTAEEKEKHRMNLKKFKASKATAEDKAVNNAYKERYRASVQSHDQNNNDVIRQVLITSNGFVKQAIGIWLRFHHVLLLMG